MGIHGSSLIFFVRPRFENLYSEIRWYIRVATNLEISMLWVRWIMECLGSMASISIAFATHGPGMMPAEEVANLEGQYLQYRAAYNSFLGTIKQHKLLYVLLSVCSSLFGEIWFSPPKILNLYPC